MIYTKPFKTYDELIDKLINENGLIVSDRMSALKILQTLTYYDLINGYQEIMMDKCQKFKQGVSIEYLYLFHVFNKNLQSILFKQSLLIENTFKNHLAYVLSKNFGVDVSVYLRDNNFHKTSNKLEFKNVKKEIENIYKGTNSYITPCPTRYYLEKHNHLPAWILFKNISFGNAINLFRLLKAREKTALFQFLPSDILDYKEKNQFFITGLNIIRDFRNQIAHNLKFVNHTYSQKLSVKVLAQATPKCLITRAEAKNNQIAQNDIYAMILLILYFLKSDKYLTSLFCDELINLITPQIYGDTTVNLYQDYSLITKLPIDLASRLHIYKSTL